MREKKQENGKSEKTYLQNTQHIVVTMEKYFLEYLYTLQYLNNH